MSVQIDPSVFLEESVSEETRASNARVAEGAASGPPIHARQPEEIREERLTGSGSAPAPVYLEQAQQRSIPGPGGEIPLRVFVPDRVEGVHLFIHGGGWVLGRADGQDPRLWELATEANVAVVSVEYRLAPEHPFPAGPDDCEAAALWLLEHGAEEFGSDRFTIGGSSAGGHLAALTLVRLHDRRGDTGFVGADLVFGAYDFGMTPSQRTAHESPVIPTPTLEWFYDHTVPDASTRRDPEISPLYADLAGLPPALFTVGTLDPLLDDSLFMAQRWAAAGNEAELAVYPGGLHGFTATPTLAIGAEARQRSNEFVRDAVAAAG